MATSDPALLTKLASAAGVFMPPRRLRSWIERSFRFFNRFSPLPPTILEAPVAMTAADFANLTDSSVSKLLDRYRITALADFYDTAGKITILDIDDRDRLFKGLFANREAFKAGLAARVTVRRGSHRIQLRILSSMACRMLAAIGHRTVVEEIILYHLFTDEEMGKVRIGLEFAAKIRFAQMNDDWLEIDGDETSAPTLHRSAIGEWERRTFSTDVAFPVDIVYTWVDGSDPRWANRRNRRLDELGQNPMRRAANRSRWESRDELRYSLRSVALFAPWVRNIYIVTDEQVPAWLSETATDRLRVVDHKQIFPDQSGLPVFNSHAIETCLHRIPGLSEHFVYMNDDIFFLRLTSKADFFTPGGQTKAFFSRSLLPHGPAHDRERASEWGGINSSTLLEDRFGATSRFKTKHTPFPVRKSVLQELEATFSSEFAYTRETPFRSPDDIAPISALHLNYSTLIGSGVPSDISYTYIDIASPRAEERLRRTMASRRFKVVCLNDTEENPAGLSWPAKDRLVRSTLSAAFPWRSPWERSTYR